ncbi:hypothetical protein DNTS_021393 [Danionella cerebrum]|uniref:Major facilitator superfamily (MFS) profile domain-containing protein n=1 Tax=Danionella cerebrum TaxID=2873325 RepID=A0A553R111_9TELE|nr:hypothetical protein DNTS_021393 [Danionella translucida]
MLKAHLKKVIRVVFLALLLDLLGFTLILPLLPSILDHYSQTGDAVYQSLQSIVDWFRVAVGVPMENKYNSVLFGGLIGSLYSMLQFLSSPITGALSDDYGRKPLLLLTTVGLMVSYLLWAFSRSFTVFLLSRVLGGICKGNVSLCTAVVADLPCPKARNKGMAMIGVAFSLGFTLGPLMGAYFALRVKDTEVFYQGPAGLAVLFSLADLIFIFFMLPETLQKFHCGLKNRQSTIRTHMQQGKMFFFIGISMAVIQGGYARRIKPENQIHTVSLAILSLIPAFLLIGMGRNLIMLYTGLFLYSFAAAIVVPCLSSQVSGHGTSSQKGTVMGILRSLGALALYWLAGADLCFIFSSVFFVIPIILLSCLKRLKEE